MVVLSGRSSRSTDAREAHLPTSFGLKFTHHPVNVFYLSVPLGAGRGILSGSVRHLSLSKSRFGCIDGVVRQGLDTRQISPNCSIGRLQGASFPSETASATHCNRKCISKGFV